MFRKILYIYYIKYTWVKTSKRHFKWLCTYCRYNRYHRFKFIGFKWPLHLIGDDKKNQWYLWRYVSDYYYMHKIHMLYWYIHKIIKFLVVLWIIEHKQFLENLSSFRTFSILLFNFKAAFLSNQEVMQFSHIFDLILYNIYLYTFGT